MAKLYWKYGAMNAGKSSMLLMAIHNYEEKDMNVLLFKPETDSRDGSFVISRALSVKRKVDFILKKNQPDGIYKKALSENPDCVFVDEAHWLSADQVDELSDIVDFLDIPVICYGLKTDFKGNLFEGSRRLFEVADKFEQLKTVCSHCGNNATYNLRLDEKGLPIFKGEQTLPGFNYDSLCRQCYKFSGGFDIERHQLRN